MQRLLIDEEGQLIFPQTSTGLGPVYVESIQEEAVSNALMNDRYLLLILSYIID